MVGRLMVMRLVLAVSIFSSLLLISSTQTCKEQTFTNNKVYTSCRDLPQLTSYLHWTYNRNTGSLDIAFRHTGISSTNRWVAWAINPTNNLNSAMVGAQALVAVPQSDGAPRAYTSPISGYSTTLAEGNISYPHTGLTATHQGSEVTIYATLTLPSGTTNLVHLWQDGSVTGSTINAHAMNSANLGAKESFNLNGTV